jgi:hypothetical protein
VRFGVKKAAEIRQATLFDKIRQKMPLFAEGAGVLGTKDKSIA